MNYTGIYKQNYNSQHQPLSLLDANQLQLVKTISDALIITNPERFWTHINVRQLNYPLSGIYRI
jgi:hypothetical protein